MSGTQEARGRGRAVTDMVETGQPTGQVSAEELEAHVAEHPAVADVAVITLPGARGGGPRTCAVVLLHPGSGPAAEVRSALTAFLHERVGAEAAPHRIEFAQSLPRTGAGRVSKSELVRWFATC